MSIFTAIDPNTPVRAIATTNHRSCLLVSEDGTTFTTVLFNCHQSSLRYSRGMVVQPALRIKDVALSLDFTGGEATYNGATYVLDETATVGSVVTKPIMRVVEIVQTHAGYYVCARNELDGRPHNYLNGRLLTITDYVGVRGGDDDLVTHAKYSEGHSYVVRGDHMNVALQTATFDDQPATILIVEDYEVTFPDDLSTVSVTKK